MASSVLLLLFHSSSSIFRFIQTQTHQLWQMLPPWCKISFFYRYLFFFFMTVVGFFFWSCLGPENIYYVWDFKNSCCHWVQLLCLQVSVGACWPRKPLRKKKNSKFPFFFSCFFFSLLTFSGGWRFFSSSLFHFIGLFHGRRGRMSSSPLHQWDGHTGSHYMLSFDLGFSLWCVCVCVMTLADEWTKL